MATAPNVQNYYIGKGIVRIRKAGDPDYRDIGNVPEFEFTPTIETLEHFSSRSGVREKDRTVVLEKGGTLRMVMEEWNFDNLRLALLGGEPTVDTDGNQVFEIFAENAVSCEVEFESTNEVGPRYRWYFPKVDFIPSAAINPISDEWGQLEVNGELAAVDGSFGTLTLLGEETETESESEE